jgi:protein-disulfide isomerase
MDRRTFTALLGASAVATPTFAEDAVKEPIVVPDMVQGSEDAPVTLYEYASYTCPHCASFHKNVYPSLRKNYIDTGKVKFVYREVFFDGPGLWAAMIARCGGDMRYFGIANMLYERQREWTKGAGGAEIAQNLYKLGRIAGLENEVMEACLNDQDMATAMVAKFQADSKADGVNSTPSLVLNGENIGNMSYTDLAAKLDEALK